MNVFFLAIILIAKGVIGLVLIGSSWTWAEEKLEYERFSFLTGVWISLLFLSMAMITLSGLVIQPNPLLTAGFVFAVIFYLLGIRSKTAKLRWSYAGYALVLATIVFGIAII